MTAPSRNALARASSSYLRSAMHQPIQWHEFAEEAFAAARDANKPILLDIGAVWCHWCHVMDRESYDDPEVAAIINEHYIAIKVDRDERPDVDSRYQVAVASLTGQGGWPLTAFLTPDGKPFYGGTYFPPKDAYGRPSFKRVLLSIAQAFHEKTADVLQQARMVEGAVARAETFSGGRAVSASVIDAILESVRNMFDPANGGFGNAPKFPHPSALDLVIDQAVRRSGKHPDPDSDNADLDAIFAHTLRKMASGGVYDQLAGGFHRYSVDDRWIVPHFEKMSYDNSELLKNYVHAYQASKDTFFADVARDIIRWTDEWLCDRARGGFYASQDADDSMDDDGDYFTWTLAEAKAVLTTDEAAVAVAFFGIREIGDMHHNQAKNVLRISGSVEEIAGQQQITPGKASELLSSARKKMYAARLQRPTPYVDKTVYTGWNAMSISAYLGAARVLHLPDARRFALRSLDRLLSEGWSGGRVLQHVIAYSDPNAQYREVPGVLDDYACTAIACLDAYEATADLSYFAFARSIADEMIRGFFDPLEGGFFDTRIAAPTAKPALGILGARRKPFQDSPTPSGNAIAAIALLRLYGYTNQTSYHEKAEQTLEFYGGVAAQHGIFAATYGIAVTHFTEPHTQVVIIGDGEIANQLYRTALLPMNLNTTVLKLDRNQAVAPNLPPALAETLPHLPALKQPQPFAVICSDFSCQPPIYEPAELARALDRQVRPAP